MALEDYDHVIGIGPTCTTSFQVKRAVLKRDVPATRCAGPFDWMGIRLASAIGVLRAGFEGYFDAEDTIVQPGAPRDCWTVVDSRGVMSCHHVRRYPGETTYSRRSWANFRAWLDERVAAFKALVATEQRLLFVRGEDPQDPDGTGGLLELVDSIRRLGGAEIRVAAICFGSGEKIDISPELCRAFVRPSWPNTLALEEVDWNRDYGSGPAWKGIDDDWDRALSSV